MARQFLCSTPRQVTLSLLSTSPFARHKLREFSGKESKDNPWPKSAVPNWAWKFQMATRRVHRQMPLVGQACVIN